MIKWEVEIETLSRTIDGFDDMAWGKQHKDIKYYSNQSRGGKFFRPIRPIVLYTYVEFYQSSSSFVVFPILNPSNRSSRWGKYSNGFNAGAFID